MNKMLLLLIIIFSQISLADMEHRSGQEGHPNQKKLSIARGCFKEIDALGCGHPKEDHGFFVSCLEDKSNNLSPNCLSFFNRLYGKRI